MSISSQSSHPQSHSPSVQAPRSNYDPHRGVSIPGPNPFSPTQQLQMASISAALPSDGYLNHPGRHYNGNSRGGRPRGHRPPLSIPNTYPTPVPSLPSNSSSSPIQTFPFNRSRQYNPDRHRPPRGDHDGSNNYLTAPRDGPSDPNDSQQFSTRPRWNHNRPDTSVNNASKSPSFNAFYRQASHLEELAVAELSRTTMDQDERAQKVQFREILEEILQRGLTERFPDLKLNVQLRCYGSFAAGLAVAGSDMDLSFALAGPDADKFGDRIPRILEEILLDAGIGARLIDRTRVPILKVCKEPSEQLMTSLRQERAKYDASLQPLDKPPVESPRGEPETSVRPELCSGPQSDPPATHPSERQSASHHPTGSGLPPSVRHGTGDQTNGPANPVQQHHQPWLWHRERPAGPLDFPKTGAGVLCDINFANRLALENTELLRCYSLCDPRVGQMVQFVKVWTKTRKINSSYNGTLCSYGYVLMVLHYLMNVATPPVIPNLQYPYHPFISLDREKSKLVIDGYDVTFFRDQEVLQALAAQNKITSNMAPIGVLLRNFFHYYAYQGHSVVQNGFNWIKSAISLRTPGGLISKVDKNWTAATVTVKNDVSSY